MGTTSTACRHRACHVNSRNGCSVLGRLTFGKFGDYSFLGGWWKTQEPQHQWLQSGWMSRNILGIILTFFTLKTRLSIYWEITFPSELSWLHTFAKSTIPIESLITDAVKRSLRVLAHCHGMAVVAFIHTLINIWARQKFKNRHLLINNCWEEEIMENLQDDNLQKQMVTNMEEENCWWCRLA